MPSATDPNPSPPRHRLAILLTALALALSLLSPAAGRAQESQSPEVSSEVFRLEHILTRHLAGTFNTLKIQYQQLPDLSTVIVTDEPRKIALARELIAALDVPPEPARSVEVVVYVLAASREGSKGGDLPAALQPVARGLEDSLGYLGLSLLDTLYLRSEDGSKGGVSGGGRRDVEGDSTKKTVYELGFEKVSILDREAGPVVRFDDLWFETGSIGDTTKHQYRSALRTDLEVREGQTAVVGKATPSGTDQALVLVVSAKILNP